MKRILLLSFVLATSASAQTRPDDLNYRIEELYIGEFSVINERFRELEVVDRKPIFSLVPFLRLHAGDQLIRGQVSRQRATKVPTDQESEWSEPTFYLKRAGKVTKLYAVEQDGQLLRPEPKLIAFFDWDVTRANMDALFAACQPGPRVSTAQLALLDSQLQPDFAEYLGKGLAPLFDENPAVSPGFQSQSGEGENLKFVYAGFGFDAQTRETFQSRVTLSASGWLEEHATLIYAPPHPRYRIGSQKFSAPNGPGGYAPRNPAERRRLEAQMTRFKRFDAIVSGILGVAAAY